MELPRCRGHLPGMYNVRRRAGFTLADLLITLALLGIVLTIAAPAIGAVRSQAAVRSARDASASMIEHARALAVSRGTARVRLEPASGTMSVEAPIGIPSGSVLHLGTGYGVTLGVGSVAGAVIDFNAMGLGVMASRTITFSRGRASAGLALSSFGRIRRW